MNKKEIEIRFVSILKPVGGMGVFFMFYMWLLRPFRKVYTEKFVNQTLLSDAVLADNITSIQQFVRSLHISYLSGESILTLNYIPQFGFFFLFGMLGLIWFWPGYKVYLGLIATQLGIEILVWIFLLAGIYYSTIALNGADFLMAYLSPLVCMGFIIGTFIYQKKMNY